MEGANFHNLKTSVIIDGEACQIESADSGSAVCTSIPRRTCGTYTLKVVTKDGSVTRESGDVTVTYGEQARSSFTALKLFLALNT